MYYNLDQCERKQNGIFNSVCNIFSVQSLLSPHLHSREYFTFYALTNRWNISKHSFIKFANGHNMSSWSYFLLPNKWEESYKAAFRPITRIAIFLDMYFTTKHYLRDLEEAKVVRPNIRIFVCRFHLNGERFRSLFSPKMCWTILWYRTLVNFRNSVLEYSF